jgi:signal transduction histidine kinase
MNQSTTLIELKIAQQELLLHHKELEKCAHDLKIANENLDTGQLEKGKRANEVNSDLEEMMFTVSHRVRKSVANILGISNLLQTDKSLGIEEWREMLNIIIQSAESLNTSTEELSKFIHLKKNNCSND